MSIDFDDDIFTDDDIFDDKAATTKIKHKRYRISFRITIPSVAELLREYCIKHKMLINYDEFHVKIFVNDKEIDRETEIKIQYGLEQQIGKRIPDEVFQKAVEVIAYENKKDRLKEFLMRCREKWDGEKRIHAFFCDAFGAQYNRYTTTISKNFFVSAVARALVPGCFLKNIVVIRGPQDLNKSRALMALGQQFHKEINVSVATEKDFFMSIQGVWLVEIPEMDALRKADRNRVKAIISSTVDRFRPPYSRYMRDFPRRCIFTCTTNDQIIYDDPTGGTRFWIIEATSKADVDLIEKIREQLFGEAIWEFEKGYKYWNIDDEVSKEVKEIQENARRHDEWEDIIAAYISDIDITRVSVSEIAEKALSILPKDLDKIKQMRIAECLTVLGFKKKTVKESGRSKKVWDLEEVQ